MGAENLLESLLGPRTWQLRCTGPSGGGMEFMAMHVTVQCMVLCSNVCESHDNGLCEDGGPSSVDATCHYGTDCHDCGNRDTHLDGEGCEEALDDSGFSCNDYIQVGYTCFEMIQYYEKDCGCTSNADGLDGSYG